MVIVQIPGIPGGPETLVILFIIPLVPVLVIVASYHLIRTLSGSSDERAEELERRVDEL